MMKRRFSWYHICLVITVVLAFSASIQANQSVFGVSEDLLRSFESQKAFEQYMADNNFHLNNKFPFLQYDLLPLPLDASYIAAGAPSLDQVFFTPNKGPEAVQETARGTVVGQYSILPTEFMELVLYQNNAMEQGGLLTAQMKGQFGEYTIEAQSTVVNGFKIIYGYDAANDREQVQNLGSGLESTFLTQNAGVELSVLPGMSLNADFKKSIKGMGPNEAYKRLNLAYYPATFASFSAGYGILSTSNLAEESSVTPTATDGGETSSLEDIIIKQLGLSLQPTVNSKFSANYVFVNERGEAVSSSIAEFGLHLGDHSKEISAIYQMESDVNQTITTSAGLELGLVDLASLRAVYSKTEDHHLAANAQRSTVDLGLNLNFAKNSTFHFQYKLVLPDDLPGEEQTAEAKLVFSF